MKGILMLFTKKDRTNPEKFTFPKIENVKVTIEGVPNMVYGQGVPTRRLFEEAQRLFEKGKENPDMNAYEFFTDAFCLLIDLRPIDDTTKTGDGRKLVQTQSGVLLEITKKSNCGQRPFNIGTKIHFVLKNRTDYKKNIFTQKTV